MASSMKLIKKIIVFITIVGMTTAFITKSDSNDNVQALTEEKPSVNFKVPSFELVGIDNQRYKINANLKKPVVLNSWASWCGPCEQEAPELEKLYKQYGSQVDILGVNMTKDDSLDGVEHFVMEYGLSYPILLDKTGDVTDAYHIISVPATFFINEKGIIVDRIVGYGDPSIFTQKIKNMIEN
jgi:cytochrome c biogenesis protein CcmG/thiol:disulfide interchange protein DsbE